MTYVPTGHQNILLQIRDALEGIAEDVSALRESADRAEGERDDGDTEYRLDSDEPAVNPT